MVALLSASRLAYRAGKGGGLSLRALRTAQDKVPVLIYGCGPLASLFVRAAHSAAGAGLRIVGIIDDRYERSGRYLNDIPVLGRLSDLQPILVGLAVQGVHPRKIIVSRPAGEIAPVARAALDEAPWRHGLGIEYLPDLLNIGAAVAAPSGAARSHPLARARQALSLRARDPEPGRALRDEPQPQLLVVNRYFHPTDRRPRSC